MASLKNVVRDHRDEIVGGSAWVAIWKDGRSWEAQAFYPAGGSYEYGYDFSPQDYEAMMAISGADHKAICVNGQYTAEYFDDGEIDWRLGELSVDAIEEKLLYFYEARLKQLKGDFLDGFVCPPEAEKKYNVYGEMYTVEELREGYETITGIAYDDLTCYDKPLTDEEIYAYMLDALREKDDPSVDVLKRHGLDSWHDETFPYRMLDRLRLDCEYYLGNGGRHAKHLWATDNEREHIDIMKALWERLPEDGKPDWLPYEKILEYEEQMCGAPKVVCLSLKALFESFGPNLHFGAYIDVCVEEGKVYYDLRRDSDGKLLACDGEEFSVLGSSSGTTKLGHKETGVVVWLSKEEADVAIFDAPELSGDLVEDLLADAAERSATTGNGEVSVDVDKGLDV